ILIRRTRTGVDPCVRARRVDCRRIGACARALPAKRERERSDAGEGEQPERLHARALPRAVAFELTAHRSTVKSNVASARKRCPTRRFMVCSHSTPKRPRLNRKWGEMPAPSTYEKLVALRSSRSASSQSYSESTVSES